MIRSATFCFLLCVVYIEAASLPYEIFFSELDTPEASKGCYLRYNAFPDKEVVLVHKEKVGYSLIPPRDEGVTLKENEEIFFSCPGSKNTLVDYKKDIIAAKCSSNTEFKIDGKPVNFVNITCKSAVSGEVQETEELCGNKKGVIKHIGDTVSEKNWLTLFDVCYNEDHGDAVYAVHTLYGSAIKFGRKDAVRPGFKTGGLAKGVQANNAYKKDTQKITFGKLLGSPAEAAKYIDTKSFLARGHLSPDADFVYVSSQYSTYFFINTVPQWQAINNGNWKSLEFAVRSLAANTKKDYKVITGSFEVLSLPNVKGKKTELYLSVDKLSVPKYVWKVMYDEATKQGIAFVSLNNPFIDNIETEDMLCEDICKHTNWGSDAWKNTAKGYIYCCEVKDAARNIKAIPALDVRGILYGK